MYAALAYLDSEIRLSIVIANQRTGLMGSRRLVQTSYVGLKVNPSFVSSFTVRETIFVVRSPWREKGRSR